MGILALRRTVITVTTTNVPTSRAKRTRQTRKITDLRTALDEFLRHRSPQLLLAELPIVITIRLLWGDFGWIDVAIIAGIVALQPFTEWLIHVYILHVQPRGAVTRTLD